MAAQAKTDVAIAKALKSLPWGSVHLFGCIDKNDLTLDDTLKMLSLGFGKKDQDGQAVVGKP